MNRSVLGRIVAFVLAFGGAALAWVWFAGGSGEPSTELTTPTIAAGSTTAAADTEKAYVIDSSRSTVAFEVDEELQGQPNLVIGETDQVAGQVQIDLADLGTVQFSQIVVNARTFRTDAERRDRAIRGPIILNSASDEHELITFDITSVDGLPEAAGPGETFSFTLTGDLLIRGETNSVTFDASVVLADESTIEGSATAQVLRSDFGIGIPSVPGVANVPDEVLLTITFVAVAG
ncbi:MAG: YceI family protein [Actinomycetota bacterium]|nr:YceI family protein [Actinomycetota bacterium]